MLARHLTVMRFEEKQMVLQKGEEASWFGILLSGSLSIALPGGGEISVWPGTIVGEMALWIEDATRAATISGAKGGLIATMLVSELVPFLEKQPVVGSRLVELMAANSLRSSLDNLRRQKLVQGRSAKLTPVPDAGGDGAGDADANSAEAQTEHEAASAEMQKMLVDRDYTSEQAPLVPRLQRLLGDTAMSPHH